MLQGRQGSIVCAAAGLTSGTAQCARAHYVKGLPDASSAWRHTGSVTEGTVTAGGD
jgi:hypothetical protein